MVEPSFITELVHETLPDAIVHPIDLNGTGDHWHVIVVDPSFEGQRSFRRQRQLMDPFKPHIATDVVHALDIVALTPAEFEERRAQGKLMLPPEGTTAGPTNDADS